MQSQKEGSGRQECDSSPNQEVVAIRATPTLRRTRKGDRRPNRF
jgi:hypothetical protein